MVLRYIKIYIKLGSCSWLAAILRCNFFRKTTWQRRNNKSSNGPSMQTAPAPGTRVLSKSREYSWWISSVQSALMRACTLNQPFRVTRRLSNPIGQTLTSPCETSWFARPNTSLQSWHSSPLRYPLSPEPARSPWLSLCLPAILWALLSCACAHNDCQRNTQESELYNPS